MCKGDVFREVGPSIPAIDISRLAATLDTLDRKTHEELLAELPGIHVIELDNSRGRGGAEPSSFASFAGTANEAISYWRKQRSRPPKSIS